LPGSPPWRLLTALTALVVLVHVLLLQASPTRLGVRLDPDAARARTFATRSVEASPAPQAAPEPPAPVPAPPRLRKAKPAVRPAQAPEIQPNPVLASADIAPPAIDSIASEALQNPPDNTAASPGGTATAAELTASLAAPGSGSATVAASSALPAGPRTTQVTAIKLPSSIRLQYKMTGTSKGLNYQADAELGWKNTGSQYEAFMEISALFLGSRSMTSAGLITPTGLAPTRFADKFRTELAAHFEAEKGKITFSANTPDAPWLEGAQDRVSVFMQLGGMLAAKPEDFPAGSEITLYTIGPREADTWTFVVESEEKLQLPDGEMATLRLTRKPRREFDQKVEIWYAPSLGYLPVRNRITQPNGDFIDQKLSKIIRQ
jgi:hypothetical protein